jgi:hypothetical protein
MATLNRFPVGENSALSTPSGGPILYATPTNFTAAPVN